MQDLKPEWQTIQNLSVSKADFERGEALGAMMLSTSVQYFIWESTAIWEVWTNFLRLR